MRGRVRVFHVVEQRLQRLRRKGRRNDQRQRCGCEERDRREIFQGIVAGIAHQSRVDDERRVHDAQRVPVSRRACNHACSDERAASGPILDHQRLAQKLRGPVLHDANGDIGTACRRVGHDDADRTGGELLAERLLVHHRCHGDRGCEHKQTGHPHRALPKTPAENTMRAHRRRSTALPSNRWYTPCD